MFETSCGLAGRRAVGRGTLRALQPPRDPQASRRSASLSKPGRTVPDLSSAATRYL